MSYLDLLCYVVGPVNAAGGCSDIRHERQRERIEQLERQRGALWFRILSSENPLDLPLRMLQEAFLTRSSSTHIHTILIQYNPICDIE